MDIATTVAAWIALALAVPSAAAAAFQAQHYVRFRRPIFTVQEAELPIQPTSHGLFTLVGPGRIALNARGARYPVTLTNCGCTFWASGLREGNGVGWFTEARLTLEPEKWTQFSVEHTGFGFPGGLWPSLYGEVYLSNPRDTFIVPLKLQLAGGGSKYSLDEFGGEHWRFVDRTFWRGRRGFAGMLRALRARLPRRH
jgi:hypothetical protein